MKFVYDICRKYDKFYSIIGKHCVLSRELCLNGNSNLKNIQNIISHSCFATVANDNLSESLVKKFLNHATNVYEEKEGDKLEIGQILEIPEVETLVRERINILENIRSLDELTKGDKEMKKIAEEELTTYTESLKNLDQRLLDSMALGFGRDNCDNIILEITAGVGGQEAMLFAYNLMEMYCDHLNNLGFTYDFMERDVTSIGGIRHASLTISGRGVYEKFRHEAGIHRVQRIPATESSGRVHTSVVSVVILPQPSEIEVTIKEKDLKIETFRSSGAGGQSVNKTDSAVRIHHLPTGIVSECQIERSQIRNRNLAMIQLRMKIYEIKLNEQVTKKRDMKKKQMGFKGRNERIRTYNYLQDRVTDHRIQNGTIYGLSIFMRGGEGLQGLQEKLQKDYERKILFDTISEIERKT